MKPSFSFILVLSLITAFSILLEAVRIAYSGSNQYLFLIWNLFLAGIPFAIAWMCSWSPKINKNKWLLLGFAGLWLLFFPNAPYIITDLLHLKPKQNIPLWYDAFLIFIFAWNGLLFGLSSLYLMQQLMEQQFSKIHAWSFAVIALALCSIGIFIGRFLRWNSWDVLYDPLGIVKDTYQSYASPFFESHAWGVTGISFLFLSLAYAFFCIKYDSSPTASTNDQQ